jgi:hypothetical protein
MWYGCFMTIGDIPFSAFKSAGNGMLKTVVPVIISSTFGEAAGTIAGFFFAMVTTPVP